MGRAVAATDLVLPWVAVARLAERQHGAVSRRQLGALGLTEDQIDYASHTGRLHRVHRGVFAFGSPRLGAGGRWWAAVLACGPGAALGYRASGALWELRPTSSPNVDVVLPHRSRRTHAGVRAHCHPTLQPDELTVHDGFPTTSVARTLLDLAGTLAAPAARKAVAQAEVLHRFDLHEVVRLLARHPRHGGTAVLREILRSWETPDLTRSVLEIAFLEVCGRAGLPRPSMNSGVLGMEVDAVFPEHGVAVELDGGAFHAGVLKREDDYARRAALTVAGWRFVAFTYRQVTRAGGRQVLQTLRPLLERSGSSSPR